MTYPARGHRIDSTVTMLPGRPAQSATAPRVFDGQKVPVVDENYYTETEYLLAGLADTYRGPVTGPITVDRVDVEYCTRIVVRRPADPHRFSGRILVEPFNTTFAEDRDALWAQAGDLLQDNGDGWIGVSVRQLSVEALRRADTARYADLSIEGNDLVWSILSHLAVLIRRHELLPEVRYIYLGGYSQSALDTATFATLFGATEPGCPPLFDGYLPVAHAASFTAVSSADGLPSRENAVMAPVGVPVIDVQPQSDVEGFTAEFGQHQLTIAGSASVRRDDSDTPADRYRLYELPGAPHARCVDGCVGDESDFPTAAFVRAALQSLCRWSESNIAPPHAPRITLSQLGPVSVAAVDDLGNPLGGIRAPQLQVPLARYTAHSTPGPLCALAGATIPLPLNVLRARYGDSTGYLQQFGAALAGTVEAGFLLVEDVFALMVAAEAAARIAFDADRRLELDSP